MILYQKYVSFTKKKLKGGEFFSLTRWIHDFRTKSQNVYEICSFTKKEIFFFWYFIKNVSLSFHNNLWCNFNFVIKIWFLLSKKTMILGQNAVFCCFFFNVQFCYFAIKSPDVLLFPRICWCFPGLRLQSWAESFISVLQIRVRVCCTLMVVLFSVEAPWRRGCRGL